LVGKNKEVNLTAMSESLNENIESKHWKLDEIEMKAILEQNENLSRENEKLKFVILDDQSEIKRLKDYTALCFGAVIVLTLIVLFLGYYIHSHF
jgi:hypothetical protein